MYTKMTIDEIEEYLSSENTSLDICIKNKTNLLKINAKKLQDEKKANYLWCLRQIYIIQNLYTKAFKKMKKNEFKEAWNLLDYADINISFLEQNFDIAVENDRFHIVFINKMIKEYQKLYPYFLFLSRESIIKSEKCSICGKKISLRNQCGHKVGKLYMGELCCRIVTDFEIKATCIVTDPYDKYTVIEVEGKEYNYEAIKRVISEIDGPYENFYIKTSFIKKPEFTNISRKSKCPCGSGKKYKNCHLGMKEELMKHYDIILSKRIDPSKSRMVIYNSWK